MGKLKLCIGFLLMTLLSLAAYGQVTLTGTDGQGPKLSLTGELLGMATLGFAEESQWVVDQDNIEKGGNEPIGVYNDKNGKNGYFTSLNFGILFSPVPTVDLYSKFLIRYRPGSPYIPLQLIDAGQEEFAVKLDAVYGRVNAVKGLGFDAPLDIWLKAGKYDTQPENYHKVSRYGAEMVMGQLRTGIDYSLQMEAAYPFPFADALALSVTTNQKFGDAIDKLYDEDADGILHGEKLIQNESTFSLHSALRLKNASLPFGGLSAELLWVLNGERTYSKHAFGLDVGLDVAVSDGLTIPIGLAAALYGMGQDGVSGGNVDNVSGSAVGRSNGISLYAPTADDVGLRNDADATSFRETMRIGAAAGMRYTAIENLALDCNIGFAYSNIAHYYRDTLSLVSLALDLQATYNRYFIGGGLFLGTLSDAQWKTKQEVLDANTASNVLDIYDHTFTLKENMGFEIYCGLKFDRARFVIGFNNNKGISMSQGIEVLHEAQMVYRQKDSGKLDGLFETGGVFTKLVISW